LAEAINNHAAPSEIEGLVSATGRGCDVMFTYTKPDGISSVRKVTVQGVSGGSLRARDHADGQVKSFRIERISKARAL
jgi:predicted DNA-binding transcriptional regulator YafY